MPTIPEEPIKETTEEARQGENVKGMTSVLGISVGVVVVVFAVLLLVFYGFTAGWFGA